MSQICAALHKLLQQLPRLSFPFPREYIPLNGIYVLFEEGEFAHGTDRIVRVGTHTGDNQLRSRLNQHFLNENKDRSIFRKNIGRALLFKDNDPFLDQWELDLTTKEAKKKYTDLVDMEKLRGVEKQVTQYIQRKFSFVVFEIRDKNHRLSIESKLISTVSLCDECRPSMSWLGLYSPKEKIRNSGLWVVNELYKKSFLGFEFAELKEIVLANSSNTYHP